MNGMNGCAFDVNDVHLKITYSGAGFPVHLIARDSTEAAELLRRAQLLGARARC